MEWRRIIRSDIAASALVHLSVVVLVILLTEVHPFGAAPTEPITVDLVPASEIDQAEKREQQPAPLPDMSMAAQPAPAQSPATSQPKASTPQAASSSAPAQNAPPQSVQRQATAVPQPPPAASPSLGYAPPQPDLTVKYHVLLGLPDELPPLPPSSGPSSSGGKPGDGNDATASTPADVTSSLVAEFRRHLKTCSKLPASIARSDNVMIKLRVPMAPDGTLAADPVLIEASASPKGPILMQSAISALQACQPYAMLPKGRYGEWKVIDLTFTPQDFVG